MSTIDDIATPMEVMMEQDSNKTLQTAPPATPLSPLSSLLMTPEASTKRALASNLEEFSPLASLVATNTDSPAGKGPSMPSFSSPFNPITPSPARASSYRNRSRRKSGKKLTVPLDISLANRPTKAWLAKHGHLPGQRDAVIPSSSNKRSGADGLSSGSISKKQKKWHKTVPIENNFDRPTKSWVAKFEASRAQHQAILQQQQQQHGQHQQHHQLQGNGMNNSSSSTTVQLACPYFQSTQTLQTPNGQFFHYGDHQYP